MQKRNVLNSPGLLELKKKRRRTALNKILLVLLAFLMIFGCLVYVSRISGLNIVSIEIADNNITDADAIKAEVQQEISGDYLWFIPKANILLYPENKI